MTNRTTHRFTRSPLLSGGPVRLRRRPDGTFIVDRAAVPVIASRQPRSPALRDRPPRLTAAGLPR